MAESKPSNKANAPPPTSRAPFESHRQSKPPPRSHYASNLKSSLTALVILHHTSLVYGGLGSTLYTSPHIAPASSPTLVGLNLLNQSFFMSSFMYVGGHYSSKALRRKGTVKFVVDRLCRLAVPSVVYTVFIHPMSYAIVDVARGWGYGWDGLQGYWGSLRGLRGPVWFTGTLCAFDIGLAVYRVLFGDRTERKHDEGLPSNKPGTRSSNSETGTTTSKSLRFNQTTTILTSLTALSTIEFLFRCKHSLLSPGAYFAPISLNLGYAPQYLAAYILGVYSPNLLSILPSQTTKTYLSIISLACSAMLAVPMTIDPGSISLIAGGWNPLAATYAAWGNFTGYLVGTGLLGYFAHSVNGDWGRIDEMAYLAFLCHMPVSTAVEVLVEGWRAGPVVKTVVVGTANVVASWSVAWVWDAVWRRVQTVAMRIKQTTSQ